MRSTILNTLGDVLYVAGGRWKVPPERAYLVDAALRGPDLIELGQSKTAFTGFIRTMVSGRRPGYYVEGIALETMESFEQGVTELSMWMKRMVRNAKAIAKARRYGRAAGFAPMG